MSYSFQNPSAEVIESYLKSAKTIAIVGLSHRKEAASYQVAHFLQAAGYRIIPVNPKLEGQELLGEHVYAYLKDIRAGHIYLNTVNDNYYKHEEAETILRQSNRQDIVMNRCTKIEYMRLFV